MIELKNYNGLLFVGDPHITIKHKRMRLDENICDTILNKIEQAVDIANKENLYLVFLGDLFDDSKEQDYNMMTKLIRILNQLRTGQDIYTIVSPGGGKTAPIVCYWIHHILKINTLRIQNDDEMRQHIERLFFGYSNLDKLVYLVPTRQLAEQTLNDLLEIMGKIFAQLLTWYFSKLESNKEIQINFSKLLLPWIYKYYTGYFHSHQ